MTSTLKLDSFLPHRLTRVAAAVSERHATVYRVVEGLRAPAWPVLAMHGELDAGSELTAKEIGRRTSMHKTKVSRAVADLVERRWLERRQDEAAARFEHLRLTPAGAPTRAWSPACWASSRR